LTRPFGYSEYNLAPFDQLAGEAATTAGAIYLIVSPHIITLYRCLDFTSLRTSKIDV
jgi:hypothetical protein